MKSDKFSRESKQQGRKDDFFFMPLSFSKSKIVISKVFIYEQIMKFQHLFKDIKAASISAIFEIDYCRFSFSKKHINNCFQKIYLHIFQKD